MEYNGFISGASYKLEIVRFNNFIPQPDYSRIVDRFIEDEDKADKFIGIVRKYTDFPELNAIILNEFIEKIVVFEADKSNGRREQQVDIYLNFIGKFELPGQEIEAEPFDPVEHRRAQWREYYYKNRDKILADKAELTAQKKAEKLTAQPTKTAEEISAEEEARKEKHKAYQREYQRKWRLKKKEKELAGQADKKEKEQSA